MVLAWSLVATAVVLAALTTLLRSRRARGDRLGLNGPARGWALVPWVLIAPSTLLRFFQAREVRGPAWLVLLVAGAAVAGTLVGGGMWHNRYRADRFATRAGTGRNGRTADGQGWTRR